MLFYVAFLHSEDSYSAIVAQLPENRNISTTVMNEHEETFYVHEDLMPPP